MHDPDGIICPRSPGKGAEISEVADTKRLKMVPRLLATSPLSAYKAGITETTPTPPNTRAEVEAAMEILPRLGRHSLRLTVTRLCVVPFY